MWKFCCLNPVMMLPSWSVTTVFTCTRFDCTVSEYCGCCFCCWAGGGCGGGVSFGGLIGPCCVGSCANAQGAATMHTVATAASTARNAAERNTALNCMVGSPR